MSIETLQRARTSRRVRARDRRRPRLPRRRHHAHDRALRLQDDDRRAGHAAHGGRARSRASSTSSTPPTSSRASRIVMTDAPGMARWRKKLFIVIARNAANPVALLRPPRRPDGGAERARRAVMDAPRVLILSASIGEGHDLPGPGHRRRPAPASARASTCASRTGCSPWAGRSIAPCWAGRGWSRGPASCSSTPCTGSTRRWRPRGAWAAGCSRRWAAGGCSRSSPPSGPTSSSPPTRG